MIASRRMPCASMWVAMPVRLASMNKNIANVHNYAKRVKSRAGHVGRPGPAAGASPLDQRSILNSTSALWSRPASALSAQRGFSV